MLTDAPFEAAHAVLRDKYQIWLSPIALKAALAAWQTTTLQSDLIERQLLEDASTFEDWEKYELAGKVPDRIDYQGHCDLCRKAASRIRELEAERDTLSKALKARDKQNDDYRQSLSRLMENSASRCREAISERNAIESLTIDRCAQVAKNWAKGRIDDHRGVAALIAQAIRALKPASGNEA